MKRTFVTFIVFISTVFSLSAADGLEYRSKNYPDDGGLMYDGYFKDDKPVEITRYYKNERVRSVQKFDEEGNSTIKMFNENATPFAIGSYKGREKDGIWTFFSDKGKVSEVISYSNGKRDGYTVEHFEDGSIMDSVRYSNDVLDGERYQYYQNGQLMAKYSYKNGVVDGHYESYFDDGSRDVEGDYKNGQRDGIWHFYEQNGSIKEFKFKNGKCKKYDDALKKEVIESDRNPHIEEPTIENIY